MSTISQVYPRADQVKVLDQMVLAHDPQAYLGCVFEGGLWSFDGGRELLAAGIHRPCAYNRREQITEAGVHSTPMSLRQWRSRDAGATWSEAGTIFEGAQVSAALEDDRTRDQQINSLLRKQSGILIWSAATHVSRQCGEYVPRILLHASADRGKHWVGPHWHQLAYFSAPRPQREGWGQSSSVLRPDGAWLLFLTAMSPYNTLRPFVAMAMPDNGRFYLFSLLPADTDYEMLWPSAVMLPSGRILVAVTRKRSDSPGHTLIFASDDLGKTWQFLSRGTEIGQPADLSVLADGRLLLTYGWPLPPYRVMVRLSDDGGLNWNPPRVLRQGGGSSDLGSVRSVNSGDGQVVSVYQWNDAGRQIQFHGGHRYIAATRWQP